MVQHVLKNREGLKAAFSGAGFYFLLARETHAILGLVAYSSVPFCQRVCIWVQGVMHQHDEHDG